MDTKIIYEPTDIYPISDYINPTTCITTGNYMMEINNDTTTTYIFEVNYFSYYSLKYYIIKYSGFLGKSLSIACTTISAKAGYLPKGKTIIPFSSRFLYFYIKYSDFPDTENIYLYFQIEHGSMRSNIEYQEANADPDFITTFSSPKTKENEIWGGDSGSINKYGYIFTKSDKKYLIIYLILFSESSIIISSSIEIKNLQPKDTLTLSPNYNLD